MDVRSELDHLDQEIETLRIQYEQFFTGTLPFSPDKLHANVKRRLRKLLRAPFKNSEMSFKLKTLEGRYNTLHTYWQRVLRAREDGTYVKDVFKSNMRERFKLEDEFSQTAEGAADKALKHLFSSYRDAVQKHTGKTQNLDYTAYQKVITQRTKEFKEKNQGQKVSFKIVVQGEKVTIKATAKSVKPMTE
jgi:hypothetical protein